MKFKIILESIEEEFTIDEVEQVLDETGVTDFFFIDEIEEDLK